MPVRDKDKLTYKYVRDGDRNTYQEINLQNVGERLMPAPASKMDDLTKKICPR